MDRSHLIAASFLIVSGALRAEERLSFNRDIRPIMSDKCFACHGLDAAHRKGELRLDTPEGAYAKGESGKVAVVPGNAAESELLKRINLAADDDDVMPPLKSHKTLSSAEKATIQKWIEQGASYQKHWAFETPVKAEIPTLPPGIPVRQPMDAFIFQKLQKEGLTPQPETDKESLLRRVTLTLTGFPPSIAEIDAYLADAAPDAYEKAVDRLLASPAYGEQMARPWLDVARYGDTHGLHLDNERSMWLYRDWVVGAFNRNLPFNQFTVEQIAGDMLPNPTPDQLVATGFNRCNVSTSEGGAINEEWIFRYAVDRTTTTVQTWMGLTAGCAVCHDHKFDPMTQKEFYSLYAFFNSTADPAMDGNALVSGPTVQIRTPEQDQKAAELDKQRADAEKRLAEAAAKVVYKDPATIVPPPPVQEQELVLIEDSYPVGAQVKRNSGGEPTWINKADGPVASGERSVKISSAAGVNQDFYDTGAAPFEVPVNARFSLNVYLDPAAPPKAIMLQCNREGWAHRAMWGDPAAIPGWGAPNTGERFLAGPSPEAGKWVKLEVPAEKLGLKAGDKLKGLAFTLDTGTAYFDKLSFLSIGDDAHNPAKSLTAWLLAGEGKDTAGLPPEINAALKAKADTRQPAQLQQLKDYYLARVCSLTQPTLGPIVAEVEKFKNERAALEAAAPVTYTMKDMDQERESFVMMRGAYDKPGEKVTRNVPAVFPALPQKEKPTRLDLAQWLVSDAHPLTARVTVNRFWQQCFGVGLVKTSGDFGSQGQPPSHPELMDFLAVTFRESGWDVKKLMRTFVTSAAFRQSSAASPELWKRDPENRLLARGPRLRLDAEVVRDNALFVSGLLDRTMGGRGVRPYQPPNIWEPVAYIDSNTAKYKADEGSALYRRSLYTFLKRTAPPPFMANFDGPSREQSCTVRERSNTPMQALQLMNDVQHVEAARALAQRAMTEGGDTPESRITFTYRTVLSRAPRAEELPIIRAAFDEHLAAYQKAPAEAAKFIRQGASAPKAGLPEPELAAWTLIANLVLNLDETINRN